MTRISSVASAAVLLGALIPGGQACAQDGWHASVTPYVWFAGIKGNVGALVDNPPTPVDADFPDIFDSLSGAFMGQADIGYGQFGVVGNVDYLKVSGDHARQGTFLAVSGEIETALTESTVAAYWRVYSSDGLDFDVLAGARYTKFEAEVDLTVNGRTVSGDAEQDWWDPVIGARGVMRLNDRWSLSGYGDLGVGGESDQTWQVYGAVRYHFTDNILASLGYRYYSVEYSENNFDYDVQVGGPILGVTFAF